MKLVIILVLVAMLSPIEGRSRPMIRSNNRHDEMDEGETKSQKEYFATLKALLDSVRSKQKSSTEDSASSDSAPTAKDTAVEKTGTKKKDETVQQEEVQPENDMDSDLENEGDESMEDTEFDEDNELDMEDEFDRQMQMYADQLMDAHLKEQSKSAKDASGAKVTQKDKKSSSFEDEFASKMKKKAHDILKKMKYLDSNDDVEDEDDEEDSQQKTVAKDEKSNTKVDQKKVAKDNKKDTKTAHKDIQEDNEDGDEFDDEEEDDDMSDDFGSQMRMFKDMLFKNNRNDVATKKVENSKAKDVKPVQKVAKDQKSHKRPVMRDEDGDLNMKIARFMDQLYARHRADLSATESQFE